MAPDARRHSWRVDVQASALPQGTHERVRDLGLALSAEAAAWVWVMLVWCRRRRRRRRRCIAAAACCCASADSVTAAWSDQHGFAFLFFVQSLRDGTYTSFTAPSR